MTDVRLGIGAPPPYGPLAWGQYLPCMGIANAPVGPPKPLPPNPKFVLLGDAWERQQTGTKPMGGLWAGIGGGSSKWHTPEPMWKPDPSLAAWVGGQVPGIGNPRAGQGNLFPRGQTALRR